MNTMATNTYKTTQFERNFNENNERKEIVIKFNANIDLFITGNKHYEHI